MLIAAEAISRGAAVTFVYGKGSLAPGADEMSSEALRRLRLVEIETVDELLETMTDELQAEPYDAVLHSMAVLDYVPETHVDEKTPSGQDEWWVKLVRTPKVIKVVKQLQPSSLLIGFKLEVGKSRDELVESARRSLLSNGADLVLANDLRDLEQGRHVGYLVNAAGQVEDVAEGKEDIARLVLDAVVERSGARRS